MQDAPPWLTAASELPPENCSPSQAEDFYKLTSTDSEWVGEAPGLRKEGRAPKAPQLPGTSAGDISTEVLGAQCPDVAEKGF